MVHPRRISQDGVFVDGAPPGPLRVKVAFARAGGLAIELIETMEGQTCHSRASERFAPGLHHLAFWVRDLVSAVKAGGRWRPDGEYGTIVPDCEDRWFRSEPPSYFAPRTHLTPMGVRESRDFFTFLEGFGKSMNFTLELLDQEFANDYLQLNGHQPHSPRALT